MQNRRGGILFHLGAWFVACGSVALAQDRIHFSSLGAFEGASIAALGDVDRDGFTDLAVESARFGLAVSVVSGFSGKVLFDVPDFGNNLTTGIPMADAGDLDGDGADDLVVGYLLSHDKTVAVFSGRTGALLLAIPIPTELINHPASFGFDVAGPGDLNGDGSTDVLVGAPGVDVEFGGQPFSASGRVFAVSGVDGSTLFTVDSPLRSIEFGAALDRLGDADADGIPDFAVGARGHAFIVSGATGAVLRSFTSGRGDDFGLAIAGTGDLDRDSLPDLVIGAADTLFGGPGAVFAFSSATGAQLWRVAGSAPGAAMGQSVRRLADVNGDGVDDVVAGAPGPFFPPTTVGSVRGLSGATGAALFTVDSGPGDIRFGFHVEGLSDVNGDGVVDFALTSQPAVPPGSLGARLDIYSAEDLSLVTDVDVITSTAGGPQNLHIGVGPGAAGGLYLVLGSASGVAPGFAFGGHVVPLNIDSYLLFSVATAPNGLIRGAIGTLDASGSATATLRVPTALLPALLGVVLEHAAIIWSEPTGGSVMSVTNAATVRFER